METRPQESDGEDVSTPSKGARHLCDERIVRDLHGNETVRLSTLKMCPLLRYVCVVKELAVPMLKLADDHTRTRNGLLDSRLSYRCIAKVVLRGCREIWKPRRRRRNTPFNHDLVAFNQTSQVRLWPASTYCASMYVLSANSQALGGSNLHGHKMVWLDDCLTVWLPGLIKSPSSRSLSDSASRS